MESSLPKQLFEKKSGETSISGEMYKRFIKNYSGNMEPSDFATCICQKMVNPENYSGGEGVSDKEQQKKNISGDVFEFIVAEILKYHNITPFYTQAEMWNIPNSKFDFLCFDDEAPIIISVKISLAERWRQSAFEGLVLKQVYRRSESYVITNNEKDAINRNKDIEKNKILGIDHVYYIQSSEMNGFIDRLKLLKFKKADLINPVSKSNLIP